MEVWCFLKCSGFSVGCLVGLQQNLGELSMVKFFLRLKAPNLFETLSCAGGDTFLAFWSKDGIHTRFLQCQIGVDQWILLKSWEGSFQAQRDISRWAKGADQRSGCLEWWFGAKKKATLIDFLGNLEKYPAWIYAGRPVKKKGWWGRDFWCILVNSLSSCQVFLVFLWFLFHARGS